MMVSRFCSVFSQLLQLFRVRNFRRRSRNTAPIGEREILRVGSFRGDAVLSAGRRSLVAGDLWRLSACQGKLVQLGSERPNKSTLGYANQHREWQLFQTVFYLLLNQCQQLPLTKKFRFKNKLLSLDATLIELSLKAFPWRTTGRIKGRQAALHLGS
jgi:hypothetical protein